MRLIIEQVIRTNQDNKGNIRCGITLPIKMVVKTEGPVKIGRNLDGRSMAGTQDAKIEFEAGDTATIWGGYHKTYIESLKDLSRKVRSLGYRTKIVVN